MASRAIEINRAPVLCLWATVVARRLGYKEDEALSLAKGVTGLTAQSKGQRLGIFSKPTEAREAESDEEFYVEMLGRHVPMLNTEAGLRSVNKGKEVSAESVKKYLKSKYLDDLDAVRDAMEELANAHKPKNLADRSFGLYEKFRPNIPPGTKGWGAKGKLDLDYIRSLAK